MNDSLSTERIHEDTVEEAFGCTAWKANTSARVSALPTRKSLFMAAMPAARVAGSVESAACGVGINWDELR
jgi:hypothetical protein